MNLSNIFKSIGLEEVHARIYYILLENGALRISDIARFANYPRTSCYEYLEKLNEVSFIKQNKDIKNKKFEAVSPQLVLDSIYQKKNEIGFALTTFESKFRELEEKFQDNYENISTLTLKTWKEILEYLKSVNAKTSICLYPKDFHKYLEVDIINKLSNFIKACKSTQKFTTKNTNIKILTPESVLYLDYNATIALIILNKKIVELEWQIFSHSNINAN